MNNLFNRYKVYIAYPNKLYSKISSNMHDLRDSTVNSSRILLLSRYVKQLKNKNSAFSFTRNPYDFIISPVNYTIPVLFSQFVQNSAFLVSYLQENPDYLISIIHSTKKQWQLLYLIECIIPSIYGYFACHEYTESAILFYSKIINEFPPNSTIQIIQPFFHCSLTYHFFENSYGRYIYSVLIDKNILKNPDVYVPVYADLLIENIKQSIKFLPIEIFKILDAIQKKRWNYDEVKSLILDHFLIPELKIWSAQLDINPELKSFVYRIIDLITISMLQQKNENIELNSSPRSSSMNFQSSLFLTDFSGSTNFSSLCFNFDFPVHQNRCISRSYSILDPSKSTKISEESRKLIINMNALIDSFFVNPDQAESVYETIVLYDNYPDEIFAQFNHFTLTVYDIQFLTRMLIKTRKFPTRITSGIILNDSMKPFVGGTFYCHVFTANKPLRTLQPFFSLFKNNEIINSTVQTSDFENGLTISFLKNESFVKFLNFNKHYKELFETHSIQSIEKSQSNQIENVEKGLNYLTLMNEIKKQNDKFLYQSSFLLESFANDILNDVKSQKNILKNISFIKLFKKLTKRFNYLNLIQMKKILYLKLLDLFYVDLFDGYWNVLLDFNKFWIEFVNMHEKAKQIVANLKTKFCFFVNSVELMSKIDNQSLLVKFFIMVCAFTMINHISESVQNKSEVYEMFFKKIKSKEFILYFLIIDSLAFRVDIFQQLCTEDEINCWKCMKMNIDSYLKKNNQYYQVFTSVNEYLSAISPSVIYNTIE